MSQTGTSELGPYGSLAVAIIVIFVIAYLRPLSGDLGGIPMNWVAVIIVGIGGILGSLPALTGSS